MKIRIPTRFLPKGHQIFVLHPGKTKRFYHDFIAQDKVFLDFPGVELPRDVNALSYDVIAKLRVGNDVGRWIRGGGFKKDEPVRDFKTHIPKGKIGELAKSAPLYAHEAEGLYKKAKKGDLIIVPGSGYFSDVYFGELTAEFDPKVFAEARIYGKEFLIPARRVNWISKGQPKRRFSDRLIQLMQNRRAIIQVSSIVDKREVYNFVYGDYIEEHLGVGRIAVNRDKVDFQAFSRATSLVSYFVAMQKAIEIDEVEEFLSLSLNDGIERYYEPDYIFDTSIEIKSPGYISLLANKVAVPLFVIVMLAATGCDAPIDAVANVEIIPHPSSINDPCYLEVAERVRGVMELMHADKWQEICQRRLEASETVGLDQNAKVIGPVE